MESTNIMASTSTGMGGPSTLAEQHLDDRSLVRPAHVPPRSFVGLTSVEELNGLAPESLLDLQAVLYVLQRIARLCPGMAYALDTHILEIMRSLGETTDSKDYDDIRCEIAAIPVEGMILVPMCQGNHHTLLIFKKSRFENGITWQIRVYDSMLLRFVDPQSGYSCSGEYLGRLTENIRFLLRNLFQVCVPVRHIYIDLMWCPQQPNGYDCGVAVCLNAMQVMGGYGEAPSSQEVVAQLIAAPGLDIIKTLGQANLMPPPGSISSTHTSLYWSAGRRLVFQLSRRGVHGAPANRGQLNAAADSVSESLEELMRLERTFSSQPSHDTSFHAHQTGSAFLSIDPVNARRWQVYTRMRSRQALNVLVQRLFQKAVNLGSNTSRTRDLLVFSHATTVSINPGHETQRQNVIAAAHDNAWHDPVIVHEIREDLFSAWTSLKGT